jgi:ClpP class serine protease
VADPKPTLMSRLAGFARLLFWLLLIYIAATAYFAPNALQVQRAQALAKFQEERKSRVIVMIHRSDKVSFLGAPVGGFIGIEDSESILRAIRLTPGDVPIDLILHTPGGLVLAAEQIARALLDHKGKVTVFVPHYAMSGGTLIAMAADEIVMDPNAVLGPVDPQLGGMPAASILQVQQLKPVERVSDQTIMLADMAKKAQTQVRDIVAELLSESGQMNADKAAEVAKTMTDGRWTHDFPITVRTARQLGFKVSTDMPRPVYGIMELYPQAGSRRPSVVYLDSPGGSPMQLPSGTPDPAQAPAPTAPAPSAPAKR